MAATTYLLPTEGCGVARGKVYHRWWYQHGTGWWAATYVLGRRYGRKGYWDNCGEGQFYATKAWGR
jgi:hypothetical protein